MSISARKLRLRAFPNKLSNTLIGSSARRGAHRMAASALNVKCSLY